MKINSMKEIKAFIKPNRSKQVVNGLKDHGFDCITLSKAEGTGSHKSPDAFPSVDFKITDSPIVKLELVCNDDKVDQIVRIISEKGRSTEPGDGLIYVSSVEGAYKVKTGDPTTDF
jgi:nitrogen regulatory protein P-II 1